MPPWRPELLRALALFAQASEAMHARGLPRPVLVGGAAVEFYTGSAVMTGDVDVVTPAQEAFEDELRRLGFVAPPGPGHAAPGWLHRRSRSASKSSRARRWAALPTRCAFA